MKIIPLDAIQRVVTGPDAIDAVRKGYIAFSDGLIEQPDPLQILFKEADGSFFGDCHAKAAQGRGLPYFVIKVASGFYRNIEKRLLPNSGLVLVMSSETGHPVAVLQDDGWLTQMRTAAAGALAASIKPVLPTAALGVIGTGTQAFLQAQMITAFTGIKPVFVKGRGELESAAFAERLQTAGIDATPTTSAHEICDNAAIVVTATPSSEPVLMSDDVIGSIHIIAVGADSPGKLEIDPHLTARASLIATDSHVQCVHHGDFGAAVREGLLSEDADVSFCDVLAGKHPDLDFAGAEISMVDLTGVGVQDLAIASLVVNQLNV
ncbi:hypothetical protein [uncultured Tateyamaria sp.]|uniref:hypothetical protein n=1 Tax=uncultured Tateyamaria sp. TaxID=455651 RepID=UPI00260FDB44|nr:hypothetical protein [uncultured Tateyamaria sp.]